jgi:hypothetical protein
MTRNKIICGKGTCPDCGTPLGSSLVTWKQHRLKCKPKKIKDKQYWMCIIGGVPKEDLGFGVDGPLRMAVRDKFFELFGNDDVCSSGWGIDQERYELLRLLHLKSNDELKKLLKKPNKSKKIKL